MESFKVGSFNLYNLVLPGVIYYENKKYSESDYKKKIDWIGGQLESMDAKIVGFQEIFHEEALKNALTKTKFKPEDLIVLGETGESPVVGLATVFPLKDKAQPIEKIPENITYSLQPYAYQISEFSRPVLKVKLVISENVELTVFVCHLKSKRAEIFDNENENDFSTIAIGEARSLIRRSVEAAGIRQLVLDETLNSSNPVMLIGDLNDSTRSVTSNIISGPLPWKYDNIETKIKHWDNVLYNVFDIISQKSYRKDWPTHIYNGHYETLDHIYLSQEFYFMNKYRIGNVDFVHILDDHLKDDTLSQDKLPKWKSDHGQVVATISLKS